MKNVKINYFELILGFICLFLSFISLRDVVWYYLNSGFSEAYSLGPSAFYYPPWIFGIGMLIGGMYLIIKFLIKKK